MLGIGGTVRQVAPTHSYHSHRTGIVGVLVLKTKEENQEEIRKKISSMFVVF